MNKTNLRDQLKNLYENTLDNRINVETENGKREWRDILTNCLNQRDEESRRKAEKMFYEISVPAKQRVIMYNWIELKAVFWKSMSFGTILGYKIIKELRERLYHEHAMKLLF